MTGSDVATSMFERIGGSTTIDRLVDRFYGRMDTLPEAKIIRAMHADDLGLIRDVLKRYLTEWAGGRTFVTEGRASSQQSLGSSPRPGPFFSARKRSVSSPRNGAKKPAA